MALSEINAHDARIQRVIEAAESHDVFFEVDYVVDWDSSKYERRVIVFRDVLHYRVDEIDFAGSPTILDIQSFGEVDGRMRIVIATNAGDRHLQCKDVELLESIEPEIHPPSDSPV